MLFFLKNGEDAKPGKSLCRLGYPFPEFNNFKYDTQTDSIEWTSGKISTPRFPIDGMITRLIRDEQTIFGLELSTPGLRGQSGGPLFDKEGLVYGMQSMTRHLHLGFDIEEKEINVKGKTKKVSDYAFLHLGQCIHVEVIKTFLKEKGIKYYEGQ